VKSRPDVALGANFQSARNRQRLRALQWRAKLSYPKYNGIMPPNLKYFEDARSSALSMLMAFAHQSSRGMFKCCEKHLF